MKFEYRKLSITLIISYVICMIFTAYTLFKLQDNLVYSSKALNITDLSQAKPVLNWLYLVVSVTVLVGLAALVISLDNKNQEIIYVEKKEKRDQKKGQEDDEDGIDEFDISNIKTLISKGLNKEKLLKNVLGEVCKTLEAGIGAFYVSCKEKSKRFLELQASYALSIGESETMKFEYGEGLVGQAALEEKLINIDEIPKDYIQIASGLGNSQPGHLLIVPVKYGTRLYGVVEIASFLPFDKYHEGLVTKVFRMVAENLGSKEPDDDDDDDELQEPEEIKTTDEKSKQKKGTTTKKRSK